MCITVWNKEIFIWEVGAVEKSQQSNDQYVTTREHGGRHGSSAPPRRTDTQTQWSLDYKKRVLMQDRKSQI